MKEEVIIADQEEDLVEDQEAVMVETEEAEDLVETDMAEAEDLEVTVVDLVVETEAEEAEASEEIILTMVQERCTRPSVMNVRKSVKFLSNLHKVSQSIVVIVFRNIRNSRAGLD